MPGHLGSGWVRGSASSSLWCTLYRFADARRTGIEGWFDVPASELLDPTSSAPERTTPPRWKQAVRSRLGLFPHEPGLQPAGVAAARVDGAVGPAGLITTVVLTPITT
ncbi:MAG: hypothetical protein ACRYG2_32885, partial [Janthinobacterium lividum]